jgi:hypothetical protein
MNGVAASWALAGAALALGCAAPLAAQDRAPAASLAEVNAELETDEQARFATLFPGLAGNQQRALLEFLGQLPVGARGILVGKLIAAPADQRAGFLGYVASLAPDEWDHLARFAHGGFPRSDRASRPLGAGHQRRPGLAVQRALAGADLPVGGKRPAAQAA